MISQDKITRKLSQLDNFLKILDEIKDTQAQKFLKDKITSGAAKYYLQVSIECCLDIVNHIIASKQMRSPTDYADSFNVLAENNILNPELTTKLRQMAKFRNRLVHLYGEIDDIYILEFIKNDLKDIQRFKTTITKNYLT